MDKNNFPSQNSFTLIELLIVVTIILLLSGLSLAYYNQFNEQKKLEKETEKLVDVLELAKKKATSADIGGYSCPVFSGYQVAVGASSYSLRLCCSADCTTNYSIQTYDFPTNISSTVNNIQFKPLATGVVTAASIKIRSSAINKCQQISVSLAGVIATTSVSCQ